MQISGKKMGNIKALKESLKKGGSSLSTYIKNVPAEGITVRFLTEPEEWFGYYEYWNDESRTFVPMAQGEVLPDGARPSFRYLASAVDIDTDKVIPLKLAKTAANSLILKYDKFGTMIDRNYELQRHGEGLDTTYDVTPDAPAKLNLSKYEAVDLESVLIQARENALGEKDTEKSQASFDDDDIDDDEEELVSAKAVKAVKGRSSTMTLEALMPDDTFRNDYTQEELEFILENHPDTFDELLEEWGMTEDDDDSDLVALVLQFQEDYEGDSESAEDDEDEDLVDSDSDEDDEIVYDEDSLRSMSIKDLRLIAEDLEIETTGLSKDELVDAIIEQAEA